MHSSWWDIMDSRLLFVIQLTQEIKPLSSWIAQLLDSHTLTHKKNDAIGWKKYGAPFFSITVVILMQERLLRVSFPKKCEDDVIISFFPWWCYASMKWMNAKNSKSMEWRSVQTRSRIFLPLLILWMECFIANSFGLFYIPRQKGIQLYFFSTLSCILLTLFWVLTW